MDGEAFPVDVLATAIHYQGRALLHLVWRDITERKQAEAKLRRAKAEVEQLNEHLEHQAAHDPLTGVFNRRAILAALSREISLELRQHQGLAVGIGDIDHFKSVNDTHGHPVGDEVLCGFVRLLKNNLRPYDFLGRFGGEEFLVITPGIPPKKMFSCCMIVCGRPSPTTRYLPRPGRCPSPSAWGWRLSEETKPWRNCSRRLIPPCIGPKTGDGTGWKCGRERSAEGREGSHARYFMVGAPWYVGLV